MSVHPEVFLEPDLDTGSPVIAYAMDIEAGRISEAHQHDLGQLLHIISGSLVTTTDDGTFVAPPQMAIWIPPTVNHANDFPIKTEFRTLYFSQNFSSTLPERVTVIRVTPLLRELILFLMSSPRDYDAKGMFGRIAKVIADQITSLPAAPLHLTMPKDAKLRKIAQQLISRPAEAPTLSMAAAEAALSQRTFERKFLAETGVSYRSWCRQAKLFRALEFLSAGRRVGDIAHDLGYEGTSAFIASFRKAFGTTPGQYIADKS
ncbi:MAG: helix-turn-helix transcriptional regulator [Stappiaceae bacterium]